MIRFDLSIELDYNIQSTSDFVFIIQPTQTPYQRVTWESLSTEPVLDIQEEPHGTPANRHLRVRAEPGSFRLRYDAIVDLVHHFALPADLREVPIAELPASVLSYIYPSRYCQSDRLMSVAHAEFGSMAQGYGRVEAIREWVQKRTKFQIGSSNPGTSALETYECATGVCRDFAHLAVAFCRCMNIPARYCAGYLGDIGVPPADAPMDFAGWFEAFLDGQWYAFDPRNNEPRIGRILMARGRDAADVAITTTFGPNILKSFKVWTDEVLP